MTPEQLAAFAAFSVVAAITPGPSNTMLTATGAAVGVTRGLPALLGVSVGMGAMMTAVALGLGAVLLANPPLMTLVKWCGVAYLLWVAWKIATARPVDQVSSSGTPIGFLGAAAFQFTNPKSWLICASAAATFLDASAPAPLVQAVTLGAVFVIASLPSCLPWLAFGAILQRLLRSNRAHRTFNLAMATLLAVSVLALLL